MKPSAVLRKARKHNYMAEKLIDTFTDKLRDLLDDECAHISFSTDGLVVVYRGGMDNAAISFMDIDAFMKLTDEEEALKTLDKAGI